jgi:Zn-dependent protease with chaperone function
MFSNIIYFLIVLLIFAINFPDTTQEKSLGYSLGMVFFCWFLFAFYCRIAVHRVTARIRDGRNGQLTGEYHSLVFRLSIFAVFLFSLDVYLFDIKYWLQLIPWMKQFASLQGFLAIVLFISYLSTIWYITHPLYVIAFQTRLTRRSWIISNIKLNMPILFPYLVLTFAMDLIELSPWKGADRFMSTAEGQILFFAVLFSILIVFMPPLIQHWWGCRPFETSDRISTLKRFLREMHFKYRDILRWPIFEGRMMTAGIMGVVPRYRYILVTDSLLEVLTLEELKAVLAHEVGHAKYRHLLFYVLFFLGFMVLSFGLSDIFTFYIAGQPFFLKILGAGESRSATIFHFLQAIPILITIILYFRFLMGFFMRNFERQADLYSVHVMGSPGPAINALEKIALLSGKSRDLPSWHHFSIKERVDCLWKSLKDPTLVKRHNRLLAVSFSMYLCCTIGLGYLVNFSPIKERVEYRYVSRILKEELDKEPQNISLLQNLASVYHQMGRYKEAIEMYNRLIHVDPSQSTAMNNLAWILVTVPDNRLKDPKRALSLALEAVALDKTPIFLDTLAEAYWVNGSVKKAIETIHEAISLDKENDPYFKKQLHKFMTSKERG